MDITLSMLLDLAFPEDAVKAGSLRSGLSHIVDTDLSTGGMIPGAEMSLPVRGIRLFCNTKPSADVDESKLIRLKKQKNSILLLCGNRKIPIETDLEFSEVFNILEETFIRLRDWDMQLHQGIIENSGLQYMLDVSENIIRHTMAITDSGYKMIAFSKNIQYGDQVFFDAIEKGYLSAEAVERLDRAGFIFEDRAVVYRKGIEGFSYPMLNGTIFVERNYRYMLTALFPNNELTYGLFELFAYLLGQISLYIEANDDAFRLHRFAWASLLNDLVEGKCDQEEFSERNQYSKLPESKLYHLVSARRKDSTMRDLIKERIEQAFPKQHVFVHNESILVLFTDCISADIVPMISKLSSFIAEYNIYVSISDGVTTIFDLHKAYAQTNSSFDLGLRISQTRTLEKLGIASKDYDANIFLYSDYYPYNLISENPELFPAFYELLSDDKKTLAGNLRLLYSYLKNDCSKTHTAAELSMHRNNIIYRIDKLEERLGVSFSNEGIKTAFRFSFLALELFDPGAL